MKQELDKEQKSPESNDEKQPSNLILRPREGFPMIRSEENRMTLSRRRFLAASAAATAGAIWLKPLHVEAKYNVWGTLFKMATQFISGLLFQKFGGGLPFLKDFNLGNLLPIEGQEGFFNLTRKTDSKDPKANVLHKLVRFGRDSGAFEAGLVYLQKLQDTSGKWLDRQFPLSHVSGQLISTLGLKGLSSEMTPIEYAKELLEYYVPDNKAEIFLPQRGGIFQYLGAPSLGEAAIRIGNGFIDKTPSFTLSHEFPHISEGGHIILQTHKAGDLKLTGKEITRGQAQTEILIVPSVNSSPEMRRAHKEVARWLAESTNSDFWATESKRKEFRNVISTNLAVPGIISSYEFGKE